MKVWILNLVQCRQALMTSRRCQNTDAWKHVKFSEIDVPLNRFPLKLSSGKLARFSDGCCTAQIGNTSVMVAAVGKYREPSLSASFVPLTVDYRQKAAAAGRIPTNHFRRELAPTEQEILISRVIDRSVRPLFPKDYSFDTQLTCNLLAVDGVHDPDIVSINAASAALALSNLPWNGPIGAVRVGMIDGHIRVNPTRKEMTQSSMNLVISATEYDRVVMMEASADNVTQDNFMEAVEVGIHETRTIINGIKELCQTTGKAKRVLGELDFPKDLIKHTRLICEAKAIEVFSDYSHEKISRDIALDAIREESVKKLGEDFTYDSGIILGAVNAVIKETFRNLILETDKRCDGRELTDLRNISCSVDTFSPLHGSAVFQRGQTQVFCTCTFDSLDSAFKSDAISVITGGMKEKNFMLHYEFPSYATNETGRAGAGSRRREYGHGALAEKSLRPVVPNNFPFTIRLTSEVLESNGSSSMATVCGGSLALMDAGVPISNPVAGVAIGLISVPDPENLNKFSNYKLLTDILGIEDYLGDMDFKIAGSKDGITGIQLDVKVPGLPFHVVKEAIQQAEDAKGRILSLMQEAISKPREQKKKNWPVSENLEVPPEKRSKFYGFGSYNLKKITYETGVQLTVIDDNKFSIFAPNQDAMDEAKEIINSLLADEVVPDLLFGSIYTAEIVDIREFGVMVTLYPSMKPALLHNSQLDQRKIHHPTALGLEIGQKIAVKYFGRDPDSGTMRLSRKALQAVPSAIVKDFTTQKSDSVDTTTAKTI